MSNLKFSFRKPAPFVHIFIAYAAGILFQYYLNLPFLPLIILFFLFVLLAVLESRSNLYYKSILQLTVTLVYCFLIFFVGAVIFARKQCEIGFSNHNDHKHAAIILTIQQPISTKDSTAFTIASGMMIDSQQTSPFSFGISIRFKSDSLIEQLKYGSRILIQKPLQPIQNIGNPGSFDIKKFYLAQGVGFRINLKSSEFILLDHSEKSGLQEWIFKTRDQILKTLDKFIQDRNLAGMAKALLIGYRTDMDKELIQAYSRTGVVHIIAISGMHIALVYGLLLFIVNPVINKQIFKPIKPVLFLLVIWSFTLLTGAAPSILRSSVMFSFIIVGETVGKRTHLVNNLAASAFILLLYNPYILWDPGFQLSYAAVLGIALFYKPINSVFGLENKILRKAWSLTVVSISAQILTLPLTIYYFHQVPFLFLISNIVAVPLSGILLYLEIALLFLSAFTGPASIIAYLFSYLASWMNHFILSVGYLPFSSVQGLFISIPEVILVYALFTLIALWLKYKQRQIFLFVILSLLILSVVHSYLAIRTIRQKLMIVYNVSGHTAIDILEGHNYHFLGDSSNAVINEIKFSRIQKQATLAAIPKSVYIENSLIRSSTKTVFLVSDDNFGLQNTLKIHSDAVILSKNCNSTIAELVKIFGNTIFVFDSSNPLWKINKWKKECENLHLRHHSIPLQGAFTLEL